MIERFSISATADKLHERFGVDVPEFYKPTYNASFTKILPVITSSAPQGVSHFYWGQPPEWSKNKTPAEKIINIRTESLNEKPALKKAMMRERCIIPADGFYAWKKVGKKTSIPYRFVVTNQEVFSIAGIWEEFEDNDGKEIQTFSIITFPANTLVAQVCERMPVILDPTTEKIWLSGTATESDLLSVLKAYPPEKMDHYPVSPRISVATADGASLVIPTPPADQFGNLTLFD